MITHLSSSRAPWRAIAGLWLPDCADAALLSEVAVALTEEYGAGPSRPVIAPGEGAWAVRSGRGLGEWGGPDDNHQVASLRWGLVPAGASERAIGDRLTTIRVDSVRKRPLTKRLFERQRALVLADGLYFEHAERAERAWYAESRTGGEVLAFAALWDRWSGAPGELEYESFALLTRPACGSLAACGAHRVPIALPRASWASWLDVEGRALEAVPRGIALEQVSEVSAPLTERSAGRAQLDWLRSSHERRRAELKSEASQLALFGRAS